MRHNGHILKWGEAIAILMKLLLLGYESTITKSDSFNCNLEDRRSVNFIISNIFKLALLSIFVLNPI